jgi:hypothetical protein
MYLKLEHIL